MACVNTSVEGWVNTRLVIRLEGFPSNKWKGFQKLLFCCIFFRSSPRFSTSPSVLIVQILIIIIINSSNNSYYLYHHQYHYSPPLSMLPPLSSSSVVTLFIIIIIIHLPLSSLLKAPITCTSSSFHYYLDLLVCLMINMDFRKQNNCWV